MYKIKTKLVVYCLVYFLPVRMPETGVQTDLIVSLRLLTIRSALFVLPNPVQRYWTKEDPITFEQDLVIRSTLY